MVHKKYLNKKEGIQMKKRVLQYILSVWKLFSTQFVPIPQNVPQTKIPKRKSKKKRRDTERIEINPKKKRY